MLSRAKREGWTQQIQSAKALAKREDALAATPVEAAAISMRERAERHLERMAGVSERNVDHVETMDGPKILKSADRNYDQLGDGGGLPQAKKLLGHLGKSPREPSKLLQKPNARGAMVARKNVSRSTRVFHPRMPHGERSAKKSSRKTEQSS